MLSIQEIEKLARLCRLELSAEEKSHYAEDLSAILSYVEKLQEVDVDSTEILTTTTENVLRQDMVVGVSLDDQKKLINQAPETKDNLVKTKPVF